MCARARREHDVGEASEILGIGEETGVSGNAAEHEGVFVLDFALNDSVPESAVIGGRRNFGAHVRRRLECGMRHSEWSENFAPTEKIEGFFGKAFQRRAQDNESDVAVFDARGRVGGEGHGKGGAEKLLSSAGVEK